MTHDRRKRVEAARDRYHAEAHASPVLCLHGEADGVAFDLSRMADAAYGAGTRGTRILASIVEQLGTLEPSPFVLAVAGDGTPLSNALSALGHAVRSERIETGADDMAIGWPWLEGRIADGTLVRAPLFLYPATLSETREGPWAWTLEIAGTPWLNEPLAALFRRLTRVRFTYEDFLAHDEDGLFKCDGATWQGIIKTLQRSGITLADTAKEIPATSIAFDSMDDAKVATIPPGQFRMQHQLVLGRFPLLAASTVADLEGLLQTTLDDYSLVGAAGLFDVPPDDPGLVGRAPGRRADDFGVFGPLRRWQVLPTDPWQEDALRSVEDLLDDTDAGLVVLGPPGTGRSQLLANIVAGAIQAGLKVLVTSPRRAALDDVAWRLAGVGLGEPLALVHDPWRDRSPLCHGIAESVDPIVTDLIAPPDIAPDTQAMTELEKALGDRLDAADRAYDAVTGRDGGHPGLAELDEGSLVDVFAGLPELADCVMQVNRDDLEAALPEVERLAPEASRFIVPHPLSGRTDWGELDLDVVNRLYVRVETARAAIETWARLRAVLAPPALDKHRALLQEHARPIVQLAQEDDGDALRRHAEVIEWLEGPVPEEVHTRFVEELRAASVELQPVPPELIRLAPKELGERIQSLDKLSKMEASGLRHFSPAFWSLKKLPEKILATLPPETPTEPGPLCELHREADKWQKLCATLPDEDAFRLEAVGDPALLRALVERLDAAFAVCAAEELIVSTLTTQHGFPERPDWRAWANEGSAIAEGAQATMHCADSPFMVALVDDCARADALDGVYAAIEWLRGLMSVPFITEVRGLARDRPAAAEARLAALAATQPEAPTILKVDQTTFTLPSFVGRFLKHWAGVPADAARACRRAVEDGWRTLRLAKRSATAIEAPLVDPRELRALTETLGQLEAARTRVIVGRWKLRVHAMMEVESQRQDLTKLVNEAGRKRLRASLRQIVERYWKRGLGTLRPAWFAPLDAIASIFPKDRDTFDLVIIDEAQRASLGAAMPALLRGRRVVIMGDPCQAPPWVPRHIGKDTLLRDSYRSLLPLARGVWSQTALWWGWGARREELWTFPNKAAYAGAVLVVPNAEKRPRARCEGVRWTKVEGRWLEGTNKAEADKVVEILADVLSETIGDETPSIGVIAFTAAQAALIRRMIDKRAARDEAFRAALRKDRERPDSEQLVVGDLQEVTVDARDVLLLSLTYATTDTSKRLQSDFGQLGELDGENFLTGVVTRARVGLHLVCSFHDVALDAGRHPELGPKILDALLGYTQGVALGDERIESAALARLKAATGIETPLLEPAAGVGQVVRDQLAEPLVERGLGVSLEPLPGPAAPDMTVAPTKESAARVAIQTTRFLSEPDTFMRDVWARRLWMRQGWTLVRVTPGVWRNSAAGVIKSLEKLFSLSPRADQRIAAAAEKRLMQERLMAELAAQRLEEGLRWAREAEAEAAARWAAEAEAANAAAAEAEAAAAAEVEAAAAAEAEAAAAIEAEAAAAVEAEAAEEAAAAAALAAVAEEAAAAEEAKAQAAAAAEEAAIAALLEEEEAAEAAAAAEAAEAAEAAAVEAARIEAEAETERAAKAAAAAAEAQAEEAEVDAVIARAAAREAAATEAHIEAENARAAAADEAARVEAEAVEAARVEAEAAEAARVEAEAAEAARVKAEAAEAARMKAEAAAAERAAEDAAIEAAIARALAADAVAAEAAKAKAAEHQAAEAAKAKAAESLAAEAAKAKSDAATIETARKAATVGAAKAKATAALAAAAAAAAAAEAAAAEAEAAALEEAAAAALEEAAAPAPAALDGLARAREDEPLASSASLRSATSSEGPRAPLGPTPTPTTKPAVPRPPTLNVPRPPTLNIPRPPTQTALPAQLPTPGADAKPLPPKPALPLPSKPPMPLPPRATVTALQAAPGLPSAATPPKPAIPLPPKPVPAPAALRPPTSPAQPVAPDKPEP